MQVHGYTHHLGHANGRVVHLRPSCLNSLHIAVVILLDFLMGPSVVTSFSNLNVAEHNLDISTPIALRTGPLPLSMTMCFEDPNVRSLEVRVTKYIPTYGTTEQCF